MSERCLVRANCRACDKLFPEKENAFLGSEKGRSSVVRVGDDGTSVAGAGGATDRGRKRGASAGSRGERPKLGRSAAGAQCRAGFARWIPVGLRETRQCGQSIGPREKRCLGA